MRWAVCSFVLIISWFSFIIITIITTAFLARQLCGRHFGPSYAVTTSTVTAGGKGPIKPAPVAGGTGRGVKRPGHTGTKARVLADCHGNCTHPLDGGSLGMEDMSPQEAARGRARSLRLRTSQEHAAETFHFIPEVVAERGRARVREFTELFRALNPKLQARLEAIRAPLRTFGYELFQWQPRSATASVLKEWEL
jgi:hypothetical protein